MRRYKKLIYPLLFLTFAPFSANAAVPELTPLNYTTRYDVTVGGITIGRIRINTHEDTFSYRMSVDTKTSGLVNFFAPLESIARVAGSVINGEHRARTYTSLAKKDGKDKNRRVEVTYDPAGNILTQMRVPDQTGWRPEVPLEKANEAKDPMTGFMVLRQTLRNAMAQEQREASTLTYDGARLARMTLKVVSRAKIEIQGKYVDAINAVVTREPIDGYTPKELKKYKEGDPVIHVYFSADERLMPLQVTLGLSYATVRATLVEISTAK